ncbi:MAG: class I SAM-dependent methyltransferase [Verrucomicrobiota bacterium JB022]|nr:class I SAM-dependent methyltransferase [Verrucomicrobiota bacterium JB022]
MNPEDTRIERNTFDLPVTASATVAPDSPKKTMPGILLDAAHGLIQPTERVFLWGMLQSLNFDYIRGVEIGTWKGTTMHVMRRACDELYCIDPEPQWTPTAEDVCRSGRPVDLITGYSPDALKGIPTPFHFAFVDGDHCEEGVYRDGMALEPLMAKGGIICFHDAYHPPVAAAIQRLVNDWTRQVDHYTHACDTISKTPYGYFGGLAVFIVEAEEYTGPREPAVNWQRA